MKTRRDAGVAASIRRVIDMEADTLRDLSGAVNGAYLEAIRRIAACKGKVVVTGTGKSGLIAQKVAGTLASTGTPAIYLHPADALHGGLGVVQRGDVVLAIGKSGESDELKGILPALRRLRTPLLVITASPASTLARSADVVLSTPVQREACPLNLAPTCSTTAALAVGDALAVTLMRLKGFRASDFALLHPGGQLGKRLTLRVADLMAMGRDNPVIGVGAPIRDMLLEITRKHAGAVSVVDRRGRLVGLVTDYDLRRVLERGEDIRRRSIREVMNPRPTCVGPQMLASAALELMLDRKKPFALLPVVDGRRRSVGMLHLHDIRKLGL